LSCDSCHSKNSWDSLGFSHVGVLPNTCNSCHGNGDNGATVKPILHIPTVESCDTCHLGYAGFNNGTLSHGGATATAHLCADCHTGNKLGAPQKDAQHTTSGSQAFCGTCHVTSTWKCGSLNKPYSFAKYNWRDNSCS
jgi:hypothetical protein